MLRTIVFMQRVVGVGFGLHIYWSYHYAIQEDWILVYLHFVNFPNNFCLGSKSANDVSMVADLQNDLCWELENGFTCTIEMGASFNVYHKLCYGMKNVSSAKMRCQEHSLDMMTSSNGNIFRVTGPFIGEFPWQRPETRSFDVVFDLRLNKCLSKQSRPRWFETLSRSLWRHCNGMLAKWSEPWARIWFLISPTAFLHLNYYTWCLAACRPGKS